MEERKQKTDNLFLKMVAGLEVENGKLTLCFISDNEADKHGEKNVIKNGTLAIQRGFTVSVCEIPDETAKKMNSDSSITDMAKFAMIKEEEFIIWYARKEWDDEATTEDRLLLINKLCDLIVCIADETTQAAYLSKLTSTYQHKAEWNMALKAAKRRRLEELSRRNREVCEEYKANAIEAAVLESYFSTRQHTFRKEFNPVEERKTTQQIQDDLLPTLRIADEVIVDYMLKRGFLLIQDEDGSPVWSMWRLR